VGVEKEGCVLKREEYRDPDVEEYIKNSYRSVINLSFGG